MPELHAEKQYRHRRDLSGLDQRQKFKRFVECTEPARKHRHRPRAQREMHLAKREIVELQAERRRDKRVRQLLVREDAAQTDGRRAGIISAAISRFPAPRYTARAPPQLATRERLEPGTRG